MKLEDAIRMANESGVCRTPYTASFFFTSETLLAFARQVEAEALESAAKVCELYIKRDDVGPYTCAKAIRALKEESNAG